MTRSPAWPDVDESAFKDRSETLGAARSQLEPVAHGWLGRKADTFNPNGWAGGAASVAGGQFDGRTTEMQDTKDHLDTTIAYCDKVYLVVLVAKQAITERSDAAQHEIDQLDSSQDGYDDKVKEKVDEAYKANVDRAKSANDALTSKATGADGKPQDPGNAAQPLTGAPPTSGGAPNPDPSTPAGSSGLTLTSGEAGGGAPSSTPAAGIAPPGRDAGGGAPSSTPAGFSGLTLTSGEAGGDTPGGGSSAGAGSAGGGGGTSGNAGARPSNPSPATAAAPSKSGAGSGVPSSSVQAAGHGGVGSPSASSASGGGSPQDGAHAGAGDGGQVPASLVSQQQGAPLANAGQQPSVAPAAAHGGPATPTPQVQSLDPAAAVPSAPGGHGGGGGPSGPGGGGGHGSSGGGGGGGDSSSSYSSGGGGSMPAMPLGPPATPPPAGPGGGGSSGGGGGAGSGSGGGSGQPTGPGVNPMSTNNSAAAAAAAAAGPAPVPVSPARLERDTIAASTAGAGAAARRRGGALNDPLTLARRIGAALNAGQKDFGFFWVTGLCADGSIVVANSYGLAYIPDGVNLPAQVQMATADEVIPPAVRATWATYPILAVQGWAHAREQSLRAVIATEEQFASFDPGAAKIVLRPDDIPDTGVMAGRSRLEVIAAGAAARLASVADVGLADLLPPAPADTGAPENNTTRLWFEVTKPLMSTMPDRGIAHLKAMIVYANHAQELALHRAHTATTGPAQRAAIADWVYWQHVSVLTSDAQPADATV